VTATASALRDAVLAAVASACQPAMRVQVSEHATLAGLGLDSLDRITLAVAVEDATGLPVPDGALPGLRTVADLITLLAAQEDGARA
jgi:acyl carrier protein